MQFKPYTPVNFSEVEELCLNFAYEIEKNSEEIINILLNYESFEVVEDEKQRTLDLLKNIRENKTFFEMRIGQITAFLPRNQPLYALTCFVLIPSLMASSVHFRIPKSMRFFLQNLLDILKIKEFFPNVLVSKLERFAFLKERTAILYNERNEDSWPITEVVIFTGVPAHAEKLRLAFDKRTLFITNGSGHNPVVLADGADIDNAVEATLNLQLYNQGQDCANPNSILVLKKNYDEFLSKIKIGLKKVRTGNYRDRGCRVGPISDPEDLIRIQTILTKNIDWLDPSTPGVVHTKISIVEPTIICKPLEFGGNFEEVFAPIIFIQSYAEDNRLQQYFENTHYARNAMYVTLYGRSEYVDNLVHLLYDGKKIHDEVSILRNTHLHALGQERGTQPYGGYGYGASNLCINGHIICKPTLPQRDIFECVVMPMLNNVSLIKDRSNWQIIEKDLQKFSGQKHANEQEILNNLAGKKYIDTADIINNPHIRFIEIPEARLFTLLEEPNYQYIAQLTIKNVHDICKLSDALQNGNLVEVEDMRKKLYEIPKRDTATAEINKGYQLEFFQHVYRLLLNKDTGPRLANFLMEIDRGQALKLLEV